MRTAPDLMYSAMDTISHDEIKEKLVRHHNPDELPEDHLMKVVRVHNYPSDEDTVFFALKGTPPRGYGIFIHGHKRLILYTTRGMPFEQIMVDEVVSRYAEGG